MNSSLKVVIIVFAGSGLGGVARYSMQSFILKLYPHIFPVGTLAVNILGCFLIGIFYTLSQRSEVLSPEWRIALTTGFCGGFTTFSAFAYENVSLLKTGNYLFVSLYIISSVVFGIAAVFAGIFAIK
jgi:CrcB protein